MTGALLALLTGLGSALLPFVNAEIYAVAAATRTHALAVVLGLAVGQTLGKLILFEAARRGSSRFRRPEGRWSERITEALRSRRTGAPLVLLSAGLGLPPLAAVSLAAGASGQRRREFAALCLLGRAVRFALIVLPAASMLS